MTSTCTKTSRARLRLAIAVCLLGSLIIGAQADLEFYNPRPEAERKVGESSSGLEQLVRYLESRRQQRSHLSHTPVRLDDNDDDDDDGDDYSEDGEENVDDGEEVDNEQEQQQLRRRQQHLLSLALQKQRGLFRDDLPERPSIIDALQREAQRDPLEYVRELDRQRLLPYLEYEPAPRIKPYPLEDEMRARLMPSQLESDPRLDYPEPQQQQQQPYELEAAKHPSLESVLARKLELMAAIAAAARMHQLRERLQHQQDEQQQARRRQPEFTFSFGKAAPVTDDDEPRPFAVAPNDPRYYEEEPLLGDKHTNEETFKESRIIGTPLEQQQQQQKQTIALEARDEDSDSQGPQQSIGVTNKASIEATTSRKIWKSAREDKEADLLPEVNVGPITGSFAFGMLPEPQRRAEHDPLVVSLDKDASNRDLYFIVMVAGCSAAAMFALVLISLTWCRLRRDSKAAVDVDYPAYGVTGPNKVVSPSGDQRLAQSAQMFHFQHQKQQILAMEKSSNQEAGSVSEPESDEENDEGDYTVYECPGLAPTGEMEVKNPLFHDDSVTSQKSKQRPNGKDA